MYHTAQHPRLQFYDVIFSLVSVPMTLSDNEGRTHRVKIVCRISINNALQFDLELPNLVQ